MPKFNEICNLKSMTRGPVLSLLVTTKDRHCAEDSGGPDSASTVEYQHPAT